MNKYHNHGRRRLLSKIFGKNWAQSGAYADLAVRKCVWVGHWKSPCYRSNCMADYKNSNVKMENISRKVLEKCFDMSSYFKKYSF